MPVCYAIIMKHYFKLPFITATSVIVTVDCSHNSKSYFELQFTINKWVEKRKCFKQILFSLYQRHLVNHMQNYGYISRVYD